MKQATSLSILAFDQHPSSFGFVLLREPDELLDWGIRSFRGGVNTVKVPMEMKLQVLISKLRPDAIVLKQPTTKISLLLLRKLKGAAHRHRIPVYQVEGAVVRDTFSDRNGNKYEIATAIAERYPELSPRLGSRRKMWEAEKYSMSIFDAAAVGVAFIKRRATDPEKRNGTFSALPR